MAKRKKTKKVTKKKVLVDPKVIARAKKIGMRDDRIALFQNTESLVEYLNGISPQSDPDAKVKAGVLPPAKKYDKGMPNKFEIESKLETSQLSRNRAQFDESNLQAELRRINRKYGAHKLDKVVRTVMYKAVHVKNKLKQTVKVLVTKFEIYFEG